MRHNKKASLELSINAIVIIILAISLLGLGLMFMKNFMSKGSEQFGSIIEGVKMENPASSTDPITVAGEIVLESGTAKVLEVGFYCDSATKCTGARVGYISCMNQDGIISTPFTIFGSPISDVVAHKNIGFLVNVLSSTAGTYACTVRVYDASGTTKTWFKSKQVTFIVQ